MDAMVIAAHIDKWNVTRVLVDNGSQAEILFLSTFEQIGFGKKQMKEALKLLYGFGGNKIEPVGSISLPVFWYVIQCPYRVHNFQCGRHVLSLQRHIRKGSPQHL
jgi:hypothetical protein